MLCQKIKCTHILLNGKNKGNQCLKNNCKSHNKKNNEISNDSYTKELLQEQYNLHKTYVMEE